MTRPKNVFAGANLVIGRIKRKNCSFLYIYLTSTNDVAMCEYFFQHKRTQSQKK